MAQQQNQQQQFTQQQQQFAQNNPQNKYSNSQVQGNPRPSSTGVRPGTATVRATTTFEEAIKVIYFSIQNQVPNLPALMNFFSKFDVYQGRVFSDWELQIMFPTVDKAAFKLIHDKNQQKSPVKSGEVQMEFLIAEIELTQPNLIRQNQPKDSAYLTAQVSPACEQSLIKLSENREIQYKPSMAFDDLFKKQPQVDYHTLDRAFRECQIIAQVSELSEIVAYFAMDRVSTSFNKIQFVQGIQPWAEKMRPSNFQKQQTMGQTMDSRVQGTMNQGFIGEMIQQPQYQNNPMTPPMGQQVPQPMGYQSHNQQQQQPMGQQQLQNQQPMGNQQQQPMGQNNQQPQQQQPMGQQNQYQQHQQPQQAFPQDQKYEQCIMRFQVDLEFIHDALMMRHTGVYKWFQTHSSNGSSLNQQEFTSAIQKLNLPAIRTSQDIYMALQFNGMQMPVPTSDIEGCFKAYGRRNKPKIIPDHVLESILRAFNSDDQFITNGLNQRQTLTLDMFVQFFGQYPEHTQYYKLEQVTALGEMYSMNQDQINIQMFTDDLIRRRRDTNMIKSNTYQGIQNARSAAIQQTPGYSALNPLMPDYSSDNTRASTQADKRKPAGFRPHMDDSQIHDIIKGCFIGGKLCFDHFNGLVQNGTLTMNDFVSAVNQLGCSWPTTTIQQMFQTIDQSMNGHAMGQVMATEVDRYLHFSCRKQLSQLHDELMITIESKQQQKNANLMSEFSRTGRPGVQECSYQEFKQIITGLGVTFSENDLSFVQKKYSIGPNIQYQKFIDDIQQISRQNNQLKMTQSSQDMPTLIAESIKKKLHVLSYDFSQFLSSVQGMRPVSQQEFTDLIGRRLELVPTVCSDSILIEQYMQMNGANFGQVSINEIVRYFDNKCPKSVQQLMSDTTRKLFGQNLSQIFEKHPDFQRTKRLLMSDFSNLLVGQLKMSPIDSQFLSTCFQKDGDVDVQGFIKECGTAIQGNKATVMPTVQKIAIAANARQLQLNQILGQYRQGSSMSIPTTSFQKEIRQIVQLTPMEADGLEQAYQSLTEGPTKIDYVSFLEDIRLQAGNIDKNQVVLNKDQQDIINNLGNLFKSNKMEAEMCKSLKNQDYLDHGYMTRDQLKSAVDEVMAKIPAKAGKPPSKLANKQFDIIYSVMNQDSQGRYNWKQLLYSMFGQLETQTILNNTLFQPPSQTQVNAQPTVQIQAESPFMGQIGKKVGSKQHILVQDIQTSAKQVVQGAPLIGEQEISNILAKMQVQLSVDERTEMSMWCQRNQDSHQLVNGHKLLLALGLQPPSVEKKGPAKRVLTEQELRSSQDVIVLIRKEIMSRGIRPEQVIEKHKKSITDVSMSPKSFKDALTEEFGQSPVIAPKIQSNSILSNLIHYLVKEEPGKVSYAKLLQALALPDHEAPLKQDSIDDMLQYQAKIQNQLISGGKVPFSIIELNQFMKRQNLSLQTLLELHQNQLNSDIPVAQFEKSLANNSYMPKELPELIKSIQTSTTGTTKVSIAVLQKHLKTLVPTDSKDPRQAQAKFGKMNPQTKSKIQMISDYLIRNNITIETLHKTLDINNDGSVDKLEFVDGVSKIITTTSLTRQDLGNIFDAIDLNGDNYLSVNEFGYYLDGAKLQKDQKKAQLDQGTIAEVTREIDSLFTFLESGKGFVTAVDINRSMTGLGQNVTIDKAQEMVRSVDRDNDGHISRQEFQQLMLPILLDELVAGDDHLEDMRAKFREADTDYSGFLSVDEFYACLLSMGTDVSRQEVVNIFTEFDVNQDMQIDIDEFIKFFSVGEQIEFQEEQNVNTYMKIKKARKLNIMDFLRAFNSMPQSFTQSFFAERWNKALRNLPSSVFKAQIDPKTMLWKDMVPVLTEELPQAMIKPENRPRLRPVPTTLGSTITIEGAEGVPLPAQSAEFDRNNIVKRVIRVGLFDQVKHELVHNSAQIVAEWNQANEDVWSFNNSNTASLNPIIFRTTDTDDLNRQDVVLVFELVVYVKQQTKTTEWTAGWAQTPIVTCEKEITKIRLEIQGGSPMNALVISKDDVQTKRSGMKAIMKMLNSNIKSTIIVSFKPIMFIEAEAKLHLELLPSTCLIQKKMLYLVSGYRNYAAELLLPLMAAGNLKQPVGNVVMSCFCKILDCPDLLETVAQIWTEDHFASLTLVQKKSIELMMKKMEDIVTRIYPVLFSEGFAYHSSNATESACGDPVKSALRKQLVTHALRFNNPAAKVKVTQPPDSFTTFKPFNVREIEFEVWAQ